MFEQELESLKTALGTGVDWEAEDKTTVRGNPLEE